MFLKKCRAFKLDVTAEFFKQAGILYSGKGDINEFDEGDNVNDDDDNDENRDNDSDDDNAPGYAFFKLIKHFKF